MCVVKRIIGTWVNPVLKMWMKRTFFIPLNTLELILVNFWASWIDLKCRMIDYITCLVIYKYTYIVCNRRIFLNASPDIDCKFGAPAKWLLCSIEKINNFISFIHDKHLPCTYISSIDDEYSSNVDMVTFEILVWSRVLQGERKSIHKYHRVNLHE